METSRPKSFSRAPPGSLQPCQGRNHRAKPSVVRARDASHTRIPAQEPKDRQISPLFRVSLVSDSLATPEPALTAAPTPTSKLSSTPEETSKSATKTTTPPISDLHSHRHFNSPDKARPNFGSHRLTITSAIRLSPVTFTITCLPGNAP